MSISIYECDACGLRVEKREAFPSYPPGWMSIMTSSTVPHRSSAAVTCVSSNRILCPACGNQVRDFIKDRLGPKTAQLETTQPVYALVAVPVRTDPDGVTTWRPQVSRVDPSHPHTRQWWAWWGADCIDICRGEGIPHPTFRAISVYADCREQAMRIAEIALAQEDKVLQAMGGGMTREKFEAESAVPSRLCP